MEPEPPASRLLTLKEAATALRVHESTVAREIEEGRLGSVEIRRRVFVATDQLNDYINSRRREPCPKQEKTPRSSTRATGWSDGSTHPTTTSTGADREAELSAARARTRAILNSPSDD